MNQALAFKALQGAGGMVAGSITAPPEWLQFLLHWFVVWFPPVMIAVIVLLYFINNPLRHGYWFLIRRFVNWFPLGMTYAFLYMGRYNLTVAKNELGALMTKNDFGLIFGAGTAVYAFSFLINGPLVDRIGGKRGILIAGLGAALMNVALGVLTWAVVTGRVTGRVVGAYATLYAANMYFQSYGAVSIIKVKAYWFHVRERGLFGAIFGTLISFGVYFAFDWGAVVANHAKVTPKGEAGWLHHALRAVFAPHATGDAVWALFFLPAMILVFWIVLDLWLIKDTPEQAKFPHFDTHDASSGVMHVELSTLDLLKKVFASKLMLLFAAVELTAGVLRNGIMQWYTIFAKEIPQDGAKWIGENWGLLLCFFGIVGGFAGGLISDKFFRSRRGPPAAVLSGIMFFLTIVMAIGIRSSAVTVGVTALCIVMCVTGVHSLMSGTAAADFGGRKATATCSGIVDGCVYLGSSVQSVCVGHLCGEASGGNWLPWPLFLMPFALAGALFAMRFWHELPAATKKYIAEVEGK